MKIGYAVTHDDQLCFTRDQANREVYQIYVDRDGAQKWCDFLNMGKDEPEYTIREIDLAS